MIAGIFGGSGFVAPCTRVLSNSDLSRRFVHRTSDRSRSEVLCTHGGQPSELVQSPSENDMSTEEQDLSRQDAIVESTKAAGFYVAGIYREKASGARADRAELLRLIGVVSENGK